MLPLIGALLVSANIQYGEHQRQVDAASRGEQPIAFDKSIPSSRITSVVCAEPEQASEYNPANREDWDLCAQFRNAAAAERIDRWTYYQLLLSAVAVGLVGVTIWFSRLAWLESRDSARQARRAANIAQKELIETRGAIRVQAQAAEDAKAIGEGPTRAYVHAVSATYHPPGSYSNALATVHRPDGHIIVAVENFGATVAKNVIVRFQLQPETINDSLLYSAPARLRRADVPNVAPKQPPQDADCYIPTGVFLDTIPDGEMTNTAMLRGEVRYSDVFKNRYRSEFMFYAFRGAKGRSQLVRMEVQHPFEHRLAAFEKIDWDPEIDR